MEAVKGFFMQCQEFIVTFGQTAWEYATDPWISIPVVLLLLVLVGILFLSKKQPSRIRAFSNGAGYVDISRTALVEIIRSKSEQVDIEKRPGVIIRSRRGRLHVDVKIRLLPSRRLTEVSEILQQHLATTLKEGLGIRKLGNINVMVTGVRMKKGRAVRKELPLNPDNEPESPLAEKVDQTATFEVIQDEKANASVDEKPEMEESTSDTASTSKPNSATSSQVSRDANRSDSNSNGSASSTDPSMPFPKPNAEKDRGDSDSESNAPKKEGI